MSDSGPQSGAPSPGSDQLAAHVQSEIPSEIPLAATPALPEERPAAAAVDASAGAAAANVAARKSEDLKRVMLTSSNGVPAKPVRDS